MNYQEQIKSPKWQKKRLEILNLRGFKCEKCNCEEKQLHVHHRFYLKGRKAWEYDNDVFQVLCYICHEKEHKKDNPQIEQKWIDLINEIKSLYFDDYENLLSIIKSAKTIDPDLLENIAGTLEGSMSSSFYDITKAFNDAEKLSIENYILKSSLKEIE